MTPCYDCKTLVHRPVYVRVELRGVKDPPRTIRAPICHQCWTKRTYPAYRLPLNKR